MLSMSSFNDDTSDSSVLAKSSQENTTFSLRIVTVDHYQSFPTKSLDVCYSDFRGGEVHKVPVIRIFGVTAAGQKACMHVHGVFPYLTIQCDQTMPQKETDCNYRKFTQELALNIDKCINSAERNTNLSPHHVYKIAMTSGLPFYGYHEKEQPFLRIYFYNPRHIERVAQLLSEGVILNKVMQPYEAHIPFILQFFIDYNLFGMNFINVCQLQFRTLDETSTLCLPSSQTSETTPKSLKSSNISKKNCHSTKLKNSKLQSKLKKQTVCEIEVDCQSEDILNKINVKSLHGKNPGLLAIWEEEKTRRRMKSESSQMTPPPTQERRNIEDSESELFYKERLMNILRRNNMIFPETAANKRNVNDESFESSFSQTSSLSNTQDKELLNMVLNLVSSQNCDPDQDSILSFHCTEEAEVDDDEETIEMSQCLIEDDGIHESQVENLSVSSSNPFEAMNDNSAIFLDDELIPQFDGAGDNEACSGSQKTGAKKRKDCKQQPSQSKKNLAAAESTSTAISNTKKRKTSQPQKSSNKTPVKNAPNLKSNDRKTQNKKKTSENNQSISSHNETLSQSSEEASSKAELHCVSFTCNSLSGKCLCTQCCKLHVTLERIDLAQLLTASSSSYDMKKLPHKPDINCDIKTNRTNKDLKKSNLLSNNEAAVLKKGNFDCTNEMKKVDKCMENSNSFCEEKGKAPETLNSNSKVDKTDKCVTKSNSSADNEKVLTETDICSNNSIESFKKPHSSLEKHKVPSESSIDNMEIGKTNKHKKRPNSLSDKTKVTSDDSREIDKLKKKSNSSCEKTKVLSEPSTGNSELDRTKSNSSSKKNVEPSLTVSESNKTNQWKKKSSSSCDRCKDPAESSSGCSEIDKIDKQKQRREKTKVPFEGSSEADKTNKNKKKPNSSCVKNIDQSSDENAFYTSYKDLKKSNSSCEELKELSKSSSANYEEVSSKEGRCTTNKHKTRSDSSSKQNTVPSEASTDNSEINETNKQKKMSNSLSEKNKDLSGDDNSSGRLRKLKKRTCSSCDANRVPFETSGDNNKSDSIKVSKRRSISSSEEKLKTSELSGLNSEVDTMSECSSNLQPKSCELPIRASNINKNGQSSKCSSKEKLIQSETANSISEINPSSASSNEKLKLCEPENLPSETSKKSSSENMKQSALDCLSVEANTMNKCLNEPDPLPEMKQGKTVSSSPNSTSIRADNTTKKANSSCEIDKENTSSENLEQSELANVALNQMANCSNESTSVCDKKRTSASPSPNRRTSSRDKTTKTTKSSTEINEEVSNKDLKQSASLNVAPNEIDKCSNGSKSACYNKRVSSSSPNPDSRTSTRDKATKKTNSSSKINAEKTSSEKLKQSEPSNLNVALKNTSKCSNKSKSLCDKKRVSSASPSPNCRTISGEKTTKKTYSSKEIKKGSSCEKLTQPEPASLNVPPIQMDKCSKKSKSVCDKKRVSSSSKSRTSSRDKATKTANSSHEKTQIPFEPITSSNEINKAKKSSSEKLNQSNSTSINAAPNDTGKYPIKSKSLCDEKRGSSASHSSSSRSNSRDKATKKTNSPSKINAEKTSSEKVNQSEPVRPNVASNKTDKCSNKSKLLCDKKQVSSASTNPSSRKSRADNATKKANSSNENKIPSEPAASFNIEMNEMGKSPSKSKSLCEKKRVSSASPTPHIRTGKADKTTKKRCDKKHIRSDSANSIEIHKLSESSAEKLKQSESSSASSEIAKSNTPSSENMKSSDPVIFNSETNKIGKSSKKTNSQIFESKNDGISSESTNCKVNKTNESCVMQLIPEPAGSNNEVDQSSCFNNLFSEEKSSASPNDNIKSKETAECFEKSTSSNKNQIASKPSNSSSETNKTVKELPKPDDPSIFNNSETSKIVICSKKSNSSKKSILGEPGNSDIESNKANKPAIQLLPLLTAFSSNELNTMDNSDFLCAKKRISSASRKSNDKAKMSLKKKKISIQPIHCNNKSNKPLKMSNSSYAKKLKHSWPNSFDNKVDEINSNLNETISTFQKNQTKDAGNGSGIKSHKGLFEKKKTLSEEHDKTRKRSKKSNSANEKKLDPSQPCSLNNEMNESVDVFGESNVSHEKRQLSEPLNNNIEISETNKCSQRLNSASLSETVSIEQSIDRYRLENGILVPSFIKMTDLQKIGSERVFVKKLELPLTKPPKPKRKCIQSKTGSVKTTTPKAHVKCKRNAIKFKESTADSLICNKVTESDTNEKVTEGDAGGKFSETDTSGKITELHNSAELDSSDICYISAEKSNSNNSESNAAHPHLESQEVQCIDCPTAPSFPLINRKLRRPSRISSMSSKLRSRSAVNSRLNLRYKNPLLTSAASVVTIESSDDSKDAPSFHGEMESSESSLTVTENPDESRILSKEIEIVAVLPPPSIHVRQKSVVKKRNSSIATKRRISRSQFNTRKRRRKFVKSKSLSPGNKELTENSSMPMCGKQNSELYAVEEAEIPELELISKHPKKKCGKPSDMPKLSKSVEISENLSLPCPEISQCSDVQNDQFHRIENKKAQLKLNSMKKVNKSKAANSINKEIIETLPHLTQHISESSELPEIVFNVEKEKLLESKLISRTVWENCDRSHTVKSKDSSPREEFTRSSDMLENIPIIEKDGFSKSKVISRNSKTMSDNSLSLLRENDGIAENLLSTFEHIIQSSDSGQLVFGENGEFSPSKSNSRDSSDILPKHITQSSEIPRDIFFVETEKLPELKLVSNSPKRRKLDKSQSFLSKTVEIVQQTASTSTNIGPFQSPLLTSQNESVTLCETEAQSYFPCSNVSKTTDSIIQSKPLRIRFRRHFSDQWTTAEINNCEPPPKTSRWIRPELQFEPNHLTALGNNCRPRKVFHNPTLPKCSIGKNSTFRNSFVETVNPTCGTETSILTSPMKGASMCRPCSVDLVRLPESVSRPCTNSPLRQLTTNLEHDSFNSNVMSMEEAGINEQSYKRPVMDTVQYLNDASNDTDLLSQILCSRGKVAREIVSPTSSEHADVMWQLSYFSPIEESSSTEFSSPPRCWSPTNMFPDTSKESTAYSPAPAVPLIDYYIPPEDSIDSNEHDDEAAYYENSFSQESLSQDSDVSSSSSSLDFMFDRHLPTSLLSPMKNSASENEAEERFLNIFSTKAKFDFSSPVRPSSVKDKESYNGYFPTEAGENKYTNIRLDSPNLYPLQDNFCKSTSIPNIPDAVNSEQHCEILGGNDGQTAAPTTNMLDVSGNSQLSFYSTLNDLEIRDMKLNSFQSSSQNNETVTLNASQDNEIDKNLALPLDISMSNNDGQVLSTLPHSLPVLPLPVSEPAIVSAIEQEAAIPSPPPYSACFEAISDVEFSDEAELMTIDPNWCDSQSSDELCESSDILNKIVKSCDIDLIEPTDLEDMKTNKTLQPDDFHAPKATTEGQTYFNWDANNKTCFPDNLPKFPDPTDKFDTDFSAISSLTTKDNLLNLEDINLNDCNNPKSNNFCFDGLIEENINETFSPNGFHSFYGNDSAYGLNCSLDPSLHDPSCIVGPNLDQSTPILSEKHSLSQYKASNLAELKNSCLDMSRLQYNNHAFRNHKSGNRMFSVWEPKLKPPTKRDVIQSSHDFSIPDVVHKAAFYSDPYDFNENYETNNIAIPKIKNGRTSGLPDFVCDFSSQNTSYKQSSNPSNSFCLSSEVKKYPMMKRLLSRTNHVAIMPTSIPPNKLDVQKWMLQNISAVDHAAQCKQIRNTPKMELQNYVKGTGSGFVTNQFDMPSQPKFSTPISSPRNKLEKKRGANRNHNKVSSPLLVAALSQVPPQEKLTEKSQKCDFSISPIAPKDSPLIALLKKRKLGFDEQFPGISSNNKIQKKESPKCGRLEKKLNTSLLHDTYNSSTSDIDGPTYDNTGNFRINFGSSAEVTSHQKQHLTVMSIEILAKTRNHLRPNPKYDQISAVFFGVSKDSESIQDPKEIIGIVAVDYELNLTENSNQLTCDRYSKLQLELSATPGITKDFVYCVESEHELFRKLVDVVKLFDPEILVGFEIQMLSIGYLVERASVLNIDLKEKISRLIPIKGKSYQPQKTSEENEGLDVRIPGRIVLDLWRVVRKEITLNVYTFENVFYHVMHQRTPQYSFHTLTEWYHHQCHLSRWKVVRYYLIRAHGILQILDKLNIVGCTSELARVFGIQFYEVLSRGSQFRVESMMLRAAKPLSYIPVSPTITQRSKARAPECVPLVFEPESRFYTDPVVVLDFQSLYPSMIIAYNYCFSTCLGRVEHFEKNAPFDFGCTSLSVPLDVLSKLQNDIHIAPTGVAFVKANVRCGILPVMLEEILNTRIMVKQSLKSNKSNKALARVLDSRQLGLKLIANVTYGYTSANFSGRMPCVEVADSIVSKGRETLEKAIHIIENTPKWNAKVVYGDTDSVFVALHGRSKEQAFKIGQEIADVVTSTNPKPVKLKFEKVYLPCVLQTKKRYVGFMYETLEQEKPTFDAKGIETVRRDSCPAVGKMLEKSLKILFESRDVSAVKAYVVKQFTKVLDGRANLIDCVFAKEYRGRSGYRPGACVPALEIAKKRLLIDPRSEPRSGERVPYVVVYGFPGLPIIQLVREPHELLQDSSLRINSKYYIARVVIPPLERAFSLVGADVKSWYANICRTHAHHTLAIIPNINKPRSTLSQYFSVVNCPACNKLSNCGLCSTCQMDHQTSSLMLSTKIRQYERNYNHMKQICSSCTKSSETGSCISIDCPILFRLNVAQKDALQIPHLRNILLHELF